MTRDALESEVEIQISFQQKWKRIMSGAYFSAAALGILLGSSATITAALQYSTEASLLAGGATAVYGIEKALLLREKWAHHLRSEMELRSLRLNYLNGVLEAPDMAAAIGRILTGYAANLPIAPGRDAER